MARPGEATRILSRLRAGEAGAAEELAEIVYEELHRIASGAMARARPDHTLQPTALLNEAWLRLIGLEVDWESRAHFLGVASRAMRSVLVDHARARAADKRGGNLERVELDEAFALFEQRSGDLLELEAALERLTNLDPDLARIVELRFFGGLSHPEVARVTGGSLRGVERGWRTARDWLYRDMRDARVREDT